MSVSSLKEASESVAWLLVALPVLLPASALQGALQARLRFVELNTIQFVGSTVNQLLPLAFAASGYVELQFLVSCSTCITPSFCCSTSQAMSPPRALNSAPQLLTARI